MAFQQRPQYQQQNAPQHHQNPANTPRVNRPFGGDGKSSLYHVGDGSGDKKLLFSGTFPVEAAVANIYDAANDPQNTRPGWFKVNIYATAKGSPYIAVAPVQAMRQGGGRFGGQQSGNGGGPRFNWSNGQQAQQQEAHPHQGYYQGPQSQQRPNFQQQYEQQGGQYESEDSSQIGEEAEGAPAHRGSTTRSPAKPKAGAKPAAKTAAKKGAKRR